MSDTVSAAAIAGSLDSGGWSFLATPEGVPADVLHVAGAAYADSAPPPLLVEFSALAPDLQTVVPAAPLIDPAPSVSGGYVAMLPDAQPPVVAGALQLGN